MMKKISRPTITRKTLLTGLVVFLTTLAAAGFAARGIVLGIRNSGLRDMAAAALQSMTEELQYDYLAALDFKQQLSRQRRKELQDALKIITTYLSDIPEEVHEILLLHQLENFIDNTLAQQGLRVFIVRRHTLRPLYASMNTNLPHDMLELLDESGNPLMLNFERSFLHDRQEYAWRAIYWSENNSHLACATLSPRLDAIIVATISLDDIRIGFELRLDELQNNLSRVFNVATLGSGYTFCMDSQGNVLSHPFLEVGQNLFSHLSPEAGVRLLLRDRDTAEKQMVELHIQPPPGQDAGAMDLFYRYYRPLDWFLVYAAPRSSLTPFADMLWSRLLLVAACLLPLVATALILSAKSMATPLRSLRLLIEKLQQNEPDTTEYETTFAKLGERDDEIGDLAAQCATLHRNLAEKHRLALEELSHVLENQWALAYCRVDPQLRIRACNSSFARLCGSQKEDILNRHVSSLPCRELANELATRDRQMLQTRIPMQFELQLPASGEEPPVSYLTLKDRLGDDVVTFIRDVSKEKSLRAESLRVQSLAALGNMTPSLCFELRKTMESGLELARDLQSALRDEQSRNRGEGLHKELDGLLAYLRDIASLAEYKGGRKNVFSLSACVQASVFLLRHSLDEAGISVNSNYDNTGDTVLGDEHALRQAVCNILLNARDALAEHPVHPKFIIIDVYTEIRDGHVRVVARIEDNGPGIPLEALPHVKEPFFTTRQAQGAVGLGLCHAQRVIESLHGVLEVSSLPDRGAAIMIILPRMEL